MGILIHLSLLNPLIFLLESPQIHPLLVRIHRRLRSIVLGLACPLRIRGPRCGLWGSFDGCGPGSGGPGDTRDVDHCPRAAHLLREATADGGGGGEEIDC